MKWGKNFLKGHKDKAAETMRDLIMKMHTRSALWLLITGAAAALICGMVFIRIVPERTSVTNRSEVVNAYYNNDNDTGTVETAVREEEAGEEVSAEETEAYEAEARDETDVLKAELDDMAGTMRDGKELLDSLYETLKESGDADEALVSRLNAIRISVGDLNRRIDDAEEAFVSIPAGYDNGGDTAAFDETQLKEILSRIEEIRIAKSDSASEIEAFIEELRSNREPGKGDKSVDALSEDILACVKDEVDVELDALSEELKAEIDRQMKLFTESALASLRETETPKAPADPLPEEELLSTIAALEEQVETLKAQNEQILGAIRLMPAAGTETVYVPASSDSGEVETVVENVSLMELNDDEKKKLMEAMLDAQVMHEMDFRENYEGKILNDDYDYAVFEELYLNR